MIEKNKKMIVVASIVILLFLLLGLLFWWFFIGQESSTPSGKNIGTESDNKIEKIQVGSIIFPSLSNAEKSIIYFKKSEGDKFGFYQLNLQTSEEKMISQEFDVPDQVIYSPDYTKAILKVFYNAYIFEKYDTVFKSPGTQDRTMTTWLFDFETQQLTKLNNGVQNIAWSPDSSRILYYFYDGKTSNIAIANPDGGDWQKIKDVPSHEGIVLGFLSNEEVYYHPMLTEIGGTNLYKLNLQTKEETQPIKDNTLAEILFSPDKQKFIYLNFQSGNDQNDQYMINVASSDGSNKKDLGINTSLDKTVWLDSQNIIAAAPQDENQTDKFYKINVDNGEKTEIPYDSGGIKIDAQNLMPTADGKTLYFTSDDLLYKMEIDNKVTGNR